MRRYIVMVDLVYSIQLAEKCWQVINTGAKSAIAQKVADAVVNGATSATQKAVEGDVNEAINTVTPYVKDSLQMLVSWKRPYNQQHQQHQQQHHRYLVDTTLRSQRLKLIV